MKVCPNCSQIHNAVDWLCPACGYSPVKVQGFPAFAPELAEDGPGFRPEDYAELVSLEIGSFWFQARNSLIVWAMRCHFPRMQRYLEIGCGTGFVLAAVAEAYPYAILTGSEVSSAGLPFAAERIRGVELLQMDARHLPYVDEFDVIGAFDVLEHIEEDEVVLCQMKQALKPGGGIILTVPQHSWLWSRQDEYACHVRRYRMGELQKKVTRAGFDVVFQTSFVSLLLPIMTASRLYHRNKININPKAELRMPKLLNFAFSTVSRLECGLIRAGARFPVGGSLLVVAFKRN